MANSKQSSYSMYSTYMQSEHIGELKASAIADDIAALNFWSFEGADENELDQVFSRLKIEPEHNNNGTLSGKSQNELANILRGGGWVFEGHLGTCVKLDSPRVVDEKAIKYESVRGSGNQQLYIPHVSVRAARAIAKNRRIKRSELDGLAPNETDLNFWDWCLKTKHYLIITEGAKKACTLISAGHPAIALNGVWGWGYNVKDEHGETKIDEKGFKVKNFHPDLIQFLNGREIVLAFDRDEKEETIAKVDKAKISFAWKLIKEIKDTCVTEITWDGDYKGIDDFIAEKGKAGLLEAYAKRSEVVKPIVDPETDSRFYYSSTYKDGLYWHTVEMKEDGLPYPKKERIGNHINAIAYTKSTDGSNTAIWLEFRTQRNSTMRLLIPRAAIAGDAMEALRSMVSSGYHYNIDKRKSLIKYLFGLGEIIDREIVIADKTGWVDGSFLTPTQTYGNPDLCFRDPEPDRTLTEVKGTLDGWKSEVVAKCAGNSRLIFSLGAVFAAPLLEPAQIQSGGFHLVGITSIGKTTALNVVAGVSGLRNLPTWRSTSNALEGKAAEFNHALLPLDELKQADPQTVGASAYMLGNGQGKARMSKNLTTGKPKTWELLFLSTGELSMIDYLQQAKMQVNGGMEVRMPSIPADAGKGYGAFECIHGFDDPREFVETLETAIRRQRGTALDAYLSKLVPARAVEGFDKALRERVHSIAKQLSQPFTDSAICRVAVRFALVQVGLEIAHSYDLLPFPIEQCAWAISEMFAAWVNSRGGDGSMEIKQACNRIEMLFVSNQYNPDRIASALSPQGTKNLLAYRSDDIVTDGVEFWVPQPIFTKELADGVDKAELIKELLNRGWLKLSLDKEHNALRRRIGGRQQWFYVFRQFWNDEKSESDFGNGEIRPVSPVSPVSPPENDGIEGFQVRPGETGSQNETGLTGLSTNIPETGETGEKNETGLSRSQQEPSLGADLEGVRPVRPVRPVEKQHSRNEPEIILKFQPYDKVKPINEFHARGNDCGVVKSIESERITVVWQSDSLVRSYHADELELSPDIDSSAIKILKSENSAFQFEILPDGTIGKTVMQFERQAIAKAWNKTIADVFGFYGEVKKIEGGQANSYKWQLIYERFSLVAIDKLESRDFSELP
jgi:putative DNA primase/helicase